MKALTETEKLVMLGMVMYPHRTDKEIASVFSQRYSTFASAKMRIFQRGYLEEYYLPIFPKLGFERLATGYADFNPAISVEERVANTRRHVEVYPEMVLSLGESHRGFSLSIAENVTKIMMISLNSTRLFADLNLLEIELPFEVLLPFELSTVHRFFNLAPLMYYSFISGQDGPDLLEEHGLSRADLLKSDQLLDIRADDGSHPSTGEDLSNVEKEVMYYLVRYPYMSSAKLAQKAPYSRHTISKVRESLIEDGLIRMQRIPNLSMLGYTILSLFHARVDPKRPIENETCKNKEILQDDSIFLVSRPTELLMLAVYEDYVHYNKGMGAFTHFLKSNGYVNKIPNIRNHSLQEAIWIKKFQYHDLIKQRFSLDV